MLELDKRLLITASLVQKKRPLADIGTDHAFLPCYLILNGITPKAVASDIATGPLENAKKTVRKYELSDKIDCRLSNGLLNLTADECKETVIAGMGGNLIVDILSAVDWIKGSDIHLILQPMTHSEDVREYLMNNGFIIEEEKAVNEKNKTYIVISARHTGEHTEKDDFIKYFGIHFQSNEQASIDFTKKQLNRLTKKYNGLLQTGVNTKLKTEIEKVLCDKRLTRWKNDKS